MESTLNYIDALPNDADLLSAVAYDSKKTWGYTDELMAVWKSDLEVTPTYILHNKVVKVFDHNQLIGFYAIKTIADASAEIDYLWLIPTQFRRNYGRKIFQHLLRHLSNNNYQKATLVAEPHAHVFYEKMGGTVTGQFQSKISGRFLAIYEYQIAKRHEVK